MVKGVFFDKFKVKRCHFVRFSQKCHWDNNFLWFPKTWNFQRSIYTYFLPKTMREMNEMIFNVTGNLFLLSFLTFMAKKPQKMVHYWIEYVFQMIFFNISANFFSKIYCRIGKIPKTGLKWAFCIIKSGFLKK